MYLMYLLSNFVQRHRTAIRYTYRIILLYVYYIIAHPLTNLYSREEIKHAVKGRMRNETHTTRVTYIFIHVPRIKVTMYIMFIIYAPNMRLNHRAINRFTYIPR